VQSAAVCAFCCYFGVDAGLVGAVRWAAPEAKALAGSTPFKLQVRRYITSIADWHNTYHCLAEPALLSGTPSMTGLAWYGVCWALSPQRSSVLIIRLRASCPCIPFCTERVFLLLSSYTALDMHVTVLGPLSHRHTTSHFTAHFTVPWTFHLYSGTRSTPPAFLLSPQMCFVWAESLLSLHPCTNVPIFCLLLSHYNHCTPL
jgi:hypothetical protein